LEHPVRDLVVRTFVPADAYQIAIDLTIFRPDLLDEKLEGERETGTTATNTGMGQERKGSTD
jgi:hypothetical protein